MSYPLNLEKISQKTLTNQEWAIGTMLNFSCQINYSLIGQHNFTCILDFNTPKWYSRTFDDEIPKCVWGNKTDLADKDVCVVKTDRDVVPSKTSIRIGESVDFKCRQINYSLSHTEASTCKRKINRKSRQLKCIEKWIGTNEARSGSSLQLFCQLSPSCSDSKVNISLILFK